MDLKLTKEADKLLAVMYKEYLEKRKHGLSKSDSREFEAYYFDKIATFSSWPAGDLSDSMNELRENGLIKMYIDGSCSLNEIAIATAEDRLKDSVVAGGSYLAQFIP